MSSQQTNIFLMHVLTAIASAKKAHSNLIRNGKLWYFTVDGFGSIPRDFWAAQSNRTLSIAHAAVKRMRPEISDSVVFNTLVRERVTMETMQEIVTKICK